MRNFPRTVKMVEITQKKHTFATTTKRGQDFIFNFSGGGSEGLVESLYITCPISYSTQHT
jgi:hypothetical protein